jgi:hypothetical protein
MIAAASAGAPTTTATTVNVALAVPSDGRATTVGCFTQSRRFSSRVHRFLHYKATLSLTGYQAATANVAGLAGQSVLLLSVLSP